MIVGILKEIIANENRVAMTPNGVEVMVERGHTVLVEKDAGIASDIDDRHYKKMGACICDTPAEIYRQADMIMHVKELQSSEFRMIRENQIIFTFLHLAAQKKLTETLIKRKAICIAYETIQKADGTLPLLTPMSEVAGRMAIQEGAKYLEMSQGGQGIILGGVPGVYPGVVLVLGGGVAGLNAAKMACGLGAIVFLADVNLERLRYLSDIMPKNCFTIMSNPAAIRQLIRQADLVVGAVLIPGAKAPRLITRRMLKTMKKGSVLVDIAIDQGGCFETSKPTTHKKPTYIVDGIVHYCVSNMPGAVAKTSTYALTNATLSYALEIADMGWKNACLNNPEIKSGVNIVNGKVTCRGVADAFSLPYVAIDTLLT